MQGLHLTADCYDCLCDPTLLVEENQLISLVRNATIEAGLSIVGEKFHAFSHADGSAAGITGTLLLAESHVAIHTWPEKNAITLDAYVCNFQQDNSDKARHIIDALISAFQAQRVSRQEIDRGESDKNKNGTTATEQLSPQTSMRTQIDAILAQTTSAFQHIEIANTPEFGKIMRIDGAMMTSEKEEFFYHECLVHPAAISHGQPKTALIVGGGDGGSTEELLKYKSIEKITLCEIDAEVISLSRLHLSEIHRGAFDSSKVTIIHEDGFSYISNSNNKEFYDLILLDLTDPITTNGSNLAGSCMSPDFFQSCYAKLNNGGSLVLHLGSPFYHPQRCKKTYANLRAVFPSMYVYTVFIPLYGAVWGMTMATKFPATTATHDAAKNNAPTQLTRAMVKERLKEQHITDLQYYNASVHQALFALPNYIKDLLSQDSSYE
jgi:spermidine synthase